MAKRGRPGSKGRRDKRGRLRSDQAGPTPERRTHGLIEHPEKPIADDEGRPSRPHRIVSILMVMERQGSVTPGMRQAGEDFQLRFFTARLDPLRAASMLRSSPSTAGDALTDRIQGARYSVWRAICAVGGLCSPSGSCLWNVIGCEQPLQEWALEQGWGPHRVSQQAADGVLISMLGALEQHYK